MEAIINADLQELFIFSLFRLLQYSNTNLVFPACVYAQNVPDINFIDDTNTVLPKNVLI